MQGLFGRFGKQQPEPTPPPNGNPRQNRQSAAPADMFADFDDRDWDRPAARDLDPIASQFDTDDEETNWDDAEVAENENNPLVRPPNRRIDYAQPTLTVESPNVTNSSDLDDWAEALPAATVKSSNIREARRGQNIRSIPPNEDLWDESPLDTQELAARSTFSSGRSTVGGTRSTQVNPAVGLWAGILQQFRRFLPGPLQQLSDAILTATVILFVTVGIWFIDSLFMPGIEGMASKPPEAPVAVRPADPLVESPTIVSPEQAFIEALETQISEITSQYPDDLVQTLDVDTASDRLLVQLNPVWYTLNDDRQNSLADRMWLQAQANHFTKLEIQDSQGVSIARSPVVGKHPIILQRRLS